MENDFLSFSGSAEMINLTFHPQQVLKLRLVLPYKMFGAVRAYGKAVRETLLSISRKKLNMHKSRTIDSEISTLKVTPSPTSKFLIYFLYIKINTRALTDAKISLH